MYNFKYLDDTAFLKYFDKVKLKQQYAKIVVLTFAEEKPIAEIQGRVTGGSIALNGDSAMRRTANISFIADPYKNDLTDTKHLLSINKKVQLLIGFENNTDQYQEYPILWFPQGVFVIIDPNITRDVNGTNISLTLHDKMALLNGECGGTFPASVVLNEIEKQDVNGNVEIEQATIFQIIQQLVNHWGGEQLGKILISDIDFKIRRVVQWTGSTSLFIYASETQNLNYYHTYSTVSKQEIVDKIQADDPKQKESDILNRIHEFTYGDDVGYILSDFVYQGQLVANAGETVVTILDKIKNMLGNYEYVYDINGNFVLREIRNYLNTTYATFTINKLRKENYLVDYVSGKSVYSFDDANLVLSFGNAMKYQQIKNDFMVWGVRTSKTSGLKFPIRYHLVIDRKPQINADGYDVFFYTDDQNIKRANIPWPFDSFNKFPLQGEIGEYYYDKKEDKIYQWTDSASIGAYIETEYDIKTNPPPSVAITYDGDFPYEGKQGIFYVHKDQTKVYKWIRYTKDQISNLSNYIKIEKTQSDYNTLLNQATKYNRKKDFPIQGKKGSYYYDISTDILYKWEYHVNIKRSNYVLTDYKIKNIVARDYRNELYFNGLKMDRTNALQTNYYWIELKEEWPKIYDIQETQTEEEFEKYGGFYPQVVKNPEEIDYFLDFIDTTSSIDEFNVQNIGRRTNIMNSDLINCVFEPDFLNIAFIQAGTDTTDQLQRECQNQFIEYIQVDSETFSKFATGGYMNSAYEQIKNEIYQYTNYNEQISLTTIPIYYLQPNSRITIKDAEAGINGDYIIKNITIPLDISGTMSSSCIKAVERI